MTRLPWLLALPLAAQAAVEFNRDIRPILSDKCFHCHGPDSVNRKAGLRLDTEAGLKGKLDEILVRVATESKAKRMPPVFTGAGLGEREIALLKQWAAEGAKWQKHWSLIPPVKPAAGDGIDAFINARLAGLTPNAEAPRSALIRRVSFDLTGLPPTPEAVDAFLADRAPDAYERLVDRLLASPRYGERMAARWLDAARYADTNGYQTDAERDMWRWRDWVIEAFNRNQPFDQFTVEQLAGDLLPHATRAQKIATGFNRNHRANGEGGSLDAEFLVEYAIDRVETTSTVWLGLTMGCTRCHDHKYDPFTQKEFYSLYAFFNNIPEKGKVFKYGNSPPLIPAPTPQQDVLLAQHDQSVAAAERRFAAVNPKTPRPPAPQWAPTQALLKTFNENKLPVEAGDVARFGYYDRFTLAAWIKPAALDGAILSRAIDKEEATGYGLYLKNGKVQANFVQRWLDDCLRVETAAPIAQGVWTHVAVTYDGSRVADGIRIYVNGAPQKLTYLVDDLNQSFDTKEPFRIGAGHGQRFTGEIGEVRVYNDVLTPEEAAALGTRDDSAYKREMAFLESGGPEPLRQAWVALRDARKQRDRFVASLPTVMVMQENPSPKPAFVLNRGQYDQPGAPVSRALPASLGQLGDGPVDRLTLARWIVHRDNPLTARVTVNRFWQMLFGTGLVKTVEDFGSQGEWPSHPELLDWLAVHFMESGWDVKKLLKTMVMSDAYRRDGRVTPELLQRDPENRLLARGPRLRLAPEMVRDQALFASGLLVEKLGGPSVKPYQPAGLWKELSGGADYQRDKGENLYRRSLYTYWKRASPPPGMMTFDSAGREACTVRESRTNTPMQALTLMNDETYLEAARKLAERMLREGGVTVAGRIDRGFRIVLSRPASDKELAVLEGSYRRQIDRFRSTPGAAAKLLAQGESAADAALDSTELASYSMIASAILNLDEAVTKP